VVGVTPISAIIEVAGFGVEVPVVASMQAIRKTEAEVVVPAVVTPRQPMLQLPLLEL
jgi:hypothetical protein